MGTILWLRGGVSGATRCPSVGHAYVPSYIYTGAAAPPVRGVSRGVCNGIDRYVCDVVY